LTIHSPCRHRQYQWQRQRDRQRRREHNEFGHGWNGSGSPSCQSRKVQGQRKTFYYISVRDRSAISPFLGGSTKRFKTYFTKGRTGKSTWGLGEEVHPYSVGTSVSPMRRSSLCIVFGSQQFVIQSPGKLHSTSSLAYVWKAASNNRQRSTREAHKDSGEGLRKLAYQVCD